MCSARATEFFDRQLRIAGIEQERVHLRRNGDRFIELRKGQFPDGNFPASALITVSHFARPGMLIEIQGVAVIGG